MHGHLRLATDGGFFVLFSRDGYGTFDQCWHGDNLVDMAPGGLEQYPFCMQRMYANGAGGNSGWRNNTLFNGHFMKNNQGGTATPYYQAECIFPSNGAAGYALSNLDALSHLSKRFPMFVNTTDSISGLISWRGRYQDWKWGVNSTVDGTMDPLGTPEMMFVGQTWLPCRAAPQL
jgi:hypothetical protein